MIHRLTFIATFFAIVIIPTVFYFFYMLLKSHRKWKEELRANPGDRKYKSKEDFIDFYLQLGYEYSSIDFVYDNTQKFLRATDLVLLPTDNIITLYERTEDEWFFILNRWLKKLGSTEISGTTFKEHANPLDFEYLIRTIQS